MQMKCEFPNGEFEFSSHTNNNEVRPMLAANNPHPSSNLLNAIDGALHSSSTARTTQPAPSVPSTPPPHTPPPPPRSPRPYRRYNGNLAGTVSAHRIEVAMYRLGLFSATAAAEHCSLSTGVFNAALGKPGAWEAMQTSTQDAVADGIELRVRFIVHGHLSNAPTWFADVERKLRHSKRTETATGLPFLDTPLVHCLADAMMRCHECWVSLRRQLHVTSQAMTCALTRNGCTLRLNDRKTRLLAKLSGWPLEAVEAALGVAGKPSTPTREELASPPVNSTHAQVPTPAESHRPVPSAHMNPLPAPLTLPADPPPTRQVPPAELAHAPDVLVVARLYREGATPAIRAAAGTLLQAMASSAARPA